jgi:addiction module RelE/StbE family toxin
VKLTWSEIAVADRDRIFDYLAERNPDAALRLDERFDMAVRLLTEHPRIGRDGRVDGTRELVIGGTPYIAVYGVEPRRVLILRLLHGAQSLPEVSGEE